MRNFLFHLTIIVVWLLIAIGCWWTAYESHIANEGVKHWAEEFSQIREYNDAPPDEPHTPAPSPIPAPRYNL